MNTAKTFLLMVGLTILLVFLGQALGGSQGALFALILAGGMNVFTYFFSDRMVLAMYRARTVSEEEAPQLHRMVRRLAMQGGLPMPRVAIIPTETPNAFATGRNPEHAVVAVTQGILRLLEEDELEGVVSHELAHVRHRDILIASIAATIAGAITYLSFVGRFAVLFGGGRGRGQGNALGALLMLILAPIAAMLIQMAISRQREFAADRGGAMISHKPQALASALQKLERGAERIPMREAKPASAHMFIVNPLRGGGFVGLFRTHPPTEERVRRLMEMA